jgi:hypothetical protein
MIRLPCANATASVAANQRGQQREAFIEQLFAGDRLSKRSALDHAHGVERCAIRPLADLVDRYDARMLEARGHTCLAFEPRRERRSLAE